jgi:hypothetical protein
MRPEQRRWDTDRRGRGIASAGPMVGPIMDLLLAAGEPDWVAEDPDSHLLPHLRHECERDRSPMRFVDAHFGDGLYVVELDWHASSVSAREVREAAFWLIGSIAESSTNVVERVDGWMVVYDVVTGMVAGQTRWAPHGHAIQLRITGEPIRAMLETRA